MSGNKLVKKDDEVTEGEIIPYSNSKDLAEFINNPLPAIAEAITGAISTDKGALFGAAGRVAQGVLKGKGVQQFAKELKELREKGAIKEDYAESKYGFQSLADLLRFIDDEVPDEERLQAVKAMFFNLVAVDAIPGAEVLNYKLFLLSKRLNATQLGILAATYTLYLRHPNGGYGGGADGWFHDIAEIMGHGVRGLVESEEKALEEYLLITSRVHSDRSGINPRNCRLTDLGIKFCEHLAAYDKGIKNRA